MPIVALLTDFGLGDHYVAAMKGAILSVCPGATLVDVCHEIQPHDVEGGAFVLEAVWRDFAAGTVFVAVVDPGVGSQRRPIALAARDRLFVGPDNGLFTGILQDDAQAEVRLLANPALVRSPVSRVFHGRDLFGPVAAHLARGFPLSEVGPPVADAVRLELPLPVPTADGWLGAVVHVDRFGNLITNVGEAQLASFAGGGGVAIQVAGRVLPLVGTYAEVGAGEPCALVGSSGRLEIAVRNGRAADRLALGRSAEVRVRGTHG